MDRNLYPYTTLKATGRAEPGGDIAFDDEPWVPASAGLVPVQPASLHDLED
jgi:tRNA 2-thiocytidine biosynthesis protein TtcA